MIGTRVPFQSLSIRRGHASSNVTPEIDIRISILLGGNPIRTIRFSPENRSAFMPGHVEPERP